MDMELKELIKKAGGKEKIKIEITPADNEVYMHLKIHFKKFTYKVKPIKDLLEEKSAYNKVPSNEDDDYLPLLESIEKSIVMYSKEEQIKDTDVIFALEDLSRDPVEIPNEELRRFIRAQLRIILSIRSYTLSELRWAINTVLRSAKRHNKIGRLRGYLEFIEVFFG